MFGLPVNLDVLITFIYIKFTSIKAIFEINLVTFMYRDSLKIPNFILAYLVQQLSLTLFPLGLKA